MQTQTAERTRTHIDGFAQEAGKPPAQRPKLEVGGRIAPIIPQDIDAAYRLAVAIARAGWAPRSYLIDPDSPKQGYSVDKILVGIMHGMEVGLPPMAALQSIAVINNMPCLWGDGMLAVVINSELLEEFEETPEIDGNGDVISYTCTVLRKGMKKPIKQTFTRAQAAKAGLLEKKGPWQQYPDRMMQMRARAWALRAGFADVLKGLKSAEEMMDVTALQEQPDGSYTPEPDRPVMQPTRNGPTLDMRVDGAGDTHPANPVAPAPDAAPAATAPTAPETDARDEFVIRDEISNQVEESFSSAEAWVTAFTTKLNGAGVNDRLVIRAHEDMIERVLKCSLPVHFRNRLESALAKLEAMKASEQAQGRAALGDDPDKPQTPSGEAMAQGAFREPELLPLYDHTGDIELETHDPVIWTREFIASVARPERPGHAERIANNKATAEAMMSDQRVPEALRKSLRNIVDSAQAQPAQTAESAAPTAPPPEADEAAGSAATLEVVTQDGVIQAFTDVDQAAASLTRAMSFTAKKAPQELARLWEANANFIADLREHSEHGAALAAALEQSFARLSAAQPAAPTGAPVDKPAPADLTPYTAALPRDSKGRPITVQFAENLKALCERADARTIKLVERANIKVIQDLPPSFQATRKHCLDLIANRKKELGVA